MEGVARCGIGGSHDLVVLRGIKKLFAVPRPLRIPATAGGNLLLATRAGEGSHINFVMSGPSHPSDLCGPFEPIDLGQVGLAEVV
jgi:hypothetical protein